MSILWIVSVDISENSILSIWLLLSSSILIVYRCLRNTSFNELFKCSQPNSYVTNVISNACNELRKQAIRKQRNKIPAFQAKWVEKHRVNAFSQSEIEHLECCDDGSIASDGPGGDDIVSLIRE
ncbi:hypothetical protein AVEN_161111-1 [Araneus ventricosus]|uniref:Uncharacterized protein n=1 Tax=Araneus ventricosus TaxID=182803 RepID=A0A4Y2S054_ARAVE|nr:hypothetical protein AVEN_161111-1 [Araneus ventricosus]